MTGTRDLPRGHGGERALGAPDEKPGPGPGWQTRCLGHSPNGMVATAHHLATAAGVEVLQDGGNAFDAAAAAAFALAVCEPAASGLGGQTMMIVDVAGRRRIVLDGSSRAPHRLVPGNLVQDDLLHGHRATTVPSTPATLAYAVQQFGKLPLARVLAPGIRAAREGFEVTPLLHSLFEGKLDALRAGSAGPIFLREGRPPAAGERLRQPTLAATLERLAAAGIEDFYRGDIAAALVRDMQEHHGLLHADDLAQIPWPLERRPYSASFRGRRVFTVGPPGAGRAMIFLLNMLDCLPPSEVDLDTPRGAQLFVLADHQAQHDRKDRPYDPHLYPQVPREQMISRAYARASARRLRKRLDEAGSGRPPIPAEAGGEALGRGETTHLSVMDRQGNVVGLTQSIERVFGSCEASPELGFIYNNYLSTFEYVDISHPHYLRPGAAPWASVAPCIMYNGRRPELVIGSPGSERIVSAIAQVLLRLSNHEPLDAVAAPRLHGALDGTVSLEQERFDPAVLEHLRAHSDGLVDRGAWSFFLGCVQLVVRQGEEFVGVADPRRDGSAEGPP